jgi:multisubunit Na+/H+ antiporter MnhE subunit
LETIRDVFALAGNGNQVQVPPAVRFIVWFCGLELLWLVFVGTTQSTEVVAGLIASAVAALLVEALRRTGLLGFRVSPSALARARSVPAHVLFDFLLVLWLVVRAAARRERIRGRWLTVDFEDEEGPRGRFLRALAATLENGTPNGIVVDVDHGRVLLHSLETRVSTGKQVL